MIFINFLTSSLFSLERLAVDVIVNKIISGIFKLIKLFCKKYQRYFYGRRQQDFYELQ
jgi:hypothetical protein